VYITAKTGWSPREIAELSLGQISEYLRGWNKGTERKGNSKGQIEAFNLALTLGRQ
jgi:hypothetical protein